MRSKAPAKPRTGKTIRQEGRSRTFTGCGTCRSRHLKCDEAKPTCSCCRRLNLPCQGYAPQLLWLSAPQSEGDAAEKKSEVGSFRYPLFTEAHRSSMSLSMVLSLGHQSAGDALLDLDCESIADQELHTVGPFGVFRALQDSSIQEPSSSPPSPDDEEDMRDISLDLNEVYCLPAFPDDALEDPLQDHSSSSVVADLAGSENWMAVDVDLGLSWDWDDISQNVLPDACNMDLGAPHVGSPRNTSFEGIPTTKTLKEPPRQLELDIPSSGLKSPRISSDDYDDASSMLGRTTFSPNSLFAGSTSILPAHSTVLLRYLKTEVLETTTSTLSRGMSPWRLLLLPCALETFAEISLWNTTSYARRSIFSTLLAKSAFHLSKSVSRGESAASFWLKIGIYHQHAAQDHLKSALKTKFKGDVKYTEMLMAILSVGVVSVSGK
ncbi:hypothetical protein QQS21_000188 [Conoideocrella luteorostrata]|uniref:Zn(2)-C6 fungal-type domain-containing protein n=1 Tax=Conoideocrella luteorostrata TaxID=1105319 RepID=A0AAJ0D178_9HYPO|nr:hypothetical protein QQS21_000188 [Conoideocrella luteorostrata]